MSRALRAPLRGLPIVAVTFAAVVALSAAGTARANGVPVLVSLSYIDLSNWGPTDATGTAELIFGEGIVRLQASGLQPLTARRYHGWLVNSEQGDAISVGTFNAGPGGDVDFEGMLPPIADFGFDLVILTVEPEPDDAPQPSQDRSIGGYFSLIGPAGEDGANEAGQLQPGELPNTGMPGIGSDLVRTGLLAAAMALSLFLGLRLGRRTA